MKLNAIGKWCSCGSCGGAMTSLNSYVHWGETHSVLRVSKDNMRDLSYPPERWEGVEIALIAVPTIRSEETKSESPLTIISKL